MREKITLTQNEYRFLLVFMEIPFLPGMEDITAGIPESIPEREEIVRTLKDRGLLKESEHGTISMDRNLLVMLSCALDSSHAFAIVSHMNPLRDVYYFLNDTIIGLLRREDTVTVVWLPYLKYAIGGAAMTLEPFLNRNKEDDEPKRFEDLKEAVQFCEKEGYRTQWTFVLYGRGKSPVIVAAACSDGENQYLCTDLTVNPEEVADMDRSEEKHKSSETSKVLEVNKEDILPESGKVRQVIAFKPDRIEFANYVGSILAGFHVAGIRDLLKKGERNVEF